MFENISKAGKISFAVGVTLILIAAGTAIYYVVNPAYVVLAESLTPESSNTLIEKLQEQGIDVQLSADGTALSVPETVMQQARVNLNALSVRADHTQGLELYDSVEYGMTEHTQKVTYQRAIQGELERTLTGLSFIKGARVHITFGERRLFKAEGNNAKASVTLSLEPNHHLTQEQVAAIRNMTAAAVEDLSPENITLIDQNGNLLTGYANNEQNAGLVDYKTSLEKALQAKVDHILALYFEPSTFATSIEIAVDLTKKKQTVQTVVPYGNDTKGALVRKTERKVSRDDTASAEVQNTESSSEVEYMHGNQTEEVVFSPGKITRLSVAVALLANITQEERTKIQELVSAGVGIVPERGDMLTINVFKPVGAGKDNAEVPARISQPTPSGPAQSALVNHDKNETNWLSFEVISVFILLLLLSNFFVYRTVRRMSLTAEQRNTLLLELNNAALSQKGGI